MKLFSGLMLLFALLFIPAFASAETIPPLVLDGRPQYSLAGRMGILKDPHRTLSIDDVQLRRAEFQPVSHQVPNLGFTRSAVWVYFRIHNPGINTESLFVSYEYPVTDSIQFYFPKTGGGYEEYRGGDSVKIDVRQVQSRFFTFPLRVEPGTTSDCFLRIVSSSGMSIPVRILTAPYLAHVNIRDFFLYGALFGILSIVLVLLFSFWIRLQDRVCFWFSLYIAFFGIHVAIRGGLMGILLGETYTFNNPVNIIELGMLFFTGTKFYRVFLNLDKFSKTLDRIMAALQYGALLFILFSFFPNPASSVVSICIFVLGPIFSSTLSFVLWRKGSVSAGYFAFGWISAHLVSVSDTLRVYGLLPYHPFTELAIPLSFLAALLSFSSAIIERSTKDQLLSRKDPLTGLANRRKLHEVLETEWNRCLRGNLTLSLIMLDVDSFKNYNDTFGHKAGDQCLLFIAEVLWNYTRRAGDLAARIGGEEFVVLLPNLSLRETFALAEAIRTAVEISNETKEFRHRIHRKVTVSLGIASGVPLRSLSWDSLLTEADKALYEAKHSGRNKTMVSSRVSGNF